MFAVLMCAACAPSVALAQWSDDMKPFSAAALGIGAQGFARPPITTAVAGAYAYVPAGRSAVLLGGHMGQSFGDGHRSHAAFLMGTVGYAQTRARAWQIYPYVSAGLAALRTAPGSDLAGGAVGAGFGFDALTGQQPVGVLIGGRVGYVTRSLNDDASIAFAMVSFGVGGRARSEKGPTIARR
jgi:hypothetical protein